MIRSSFPQQQASVHEHPSWKYCCSWICMADGYHPLPSEGCRRNQCCGEYLHCGEGLQDNLLLSGHEGQHSGQHLLSRIIIVLYGLRQHLGRCLMFRCLGPAHLLQTILIYTVKAPSTECIPFDASWWDQMKSVYPLPSRVLHILTAISGERKIKDSLHCTRLVKCTSCFDEYTSH